MLKDLILANRSVRGFDRSRKVTIEEMREMVDCARLSASGTNKQPFRYYITNDEKEVELLNSLTKYGALLPELGLPFKGTEPQAFILICQDYRISNSEIRFLKDVGIVAQSITLAATEMGLNACMVGNYSPDKVKLKLGLPENLNVQLIIALGKSIENISIVEIEEGEDTAYYRDGAGRHFVPKRKLDDIVLTKDDLTE